MSYEKRNAKMKAMWREFQLAEKERTEREIEKMSGSEVRTLGSGRRE